MSKVFSIEDDSKWTKIKSSIKELALVSTTHGLPNIFRTERLFLKLMWFLFLLICSSFGIHFMITAVFNYLNYDVVVQIKQIKEIPIQFPTISFSFQDDFYGNKSNLKDRLLYCKFSDFNCDLNDFEILNEKITGYNYIKFNSGFNRTGHKIDIKNSKLAGSDNGFSAVIFTGIAENSSMLPIYIHNYTYNPEITSVDPIFLSPGYEFFLKINRVFYYKKEYPYSDCLPKLNDPNDFDSFLYKHIVTNNSYKYTQNNCYNLCLSQYLITKCNILFSLDYTWFLFQTQYKTYSKCIDEKKDDFFELNVTDFCGPQCPLECDSIQYNIDQEFLKFPSKSYANELITSSKLKSLFPENYTITYNDLKETLISIHIFYNDLSFMIISEDAKILPVDLVSTIGGLFGLFIGISFLSFGELFELLFEIIFIMFDTKNSKIMNG